MSPRILFLATVLGLAGSAHALLPVDDFTAGAVDLSGASGSDLTLDPGILGGERLTTFTLAQGSTWNPGVGQAGAFEYFGDTGWMFYNSTFNNLATWSLTYGAGADLDADLTACGADRFILAACCQLDVDADGGHTGVWGVDGTPMMLTLWSNGNDIAIARDLYGNAVESQGYIEFEFLFSQFPGIDFSDVDRIEFTFYQTAQNPAVDYGFGGIYLNCDEGGPVGAQEQPALFNLGANYPNPFNPTTTISFSMEETEVATLAVHDLAGRRLATLVDGLVERGAHEVSFDASALPSGVYFYSLESAGQSQTRKMVLTK